MALQAVIFDLDNTLVNRKLAFKAYLDSFIDTFVVVSDHAERIRIAAIDAGLRAVWLKGFMDWDAALGSSDCSINHLYELIELFEGFSTESQNII